MKAWNRQDTGSPIRGWGMRLAICLLCGFGCRSEDQHNDEHLEHVVPQHKPATFADAVIELRIRRDVLQQNRPGELDPQRLAELADIVRWLPEIAADSALLRPDWEQVQRHSVQLEHLHRQLVTNIDSEQDATDWQEIVDGLEILIPAASDKTHDTNSDPRQTVDE